MPNVTHEWIADGRILCFRFLTTTNEAVDVWYRETAAVLENWPAERPLYTLLDLRAARPLFGSRAFIRTRQISYMRPDVAGRTAVVIQHVRAARIVDAIIRNSLAAYTRQRRIFSDEANALAWLLHDTPDSADVP